VMTVGPYFMKFIAKWPTVHDLAVAKIDDVLAAWAGLGYYARARNLHKCAQFISERLNGEIPETAEELMELPGIGPYTSAAISSIAFNHQAVAMDGNVERVVSRFFAVEEPLPKSKEILRVHAAKLAANNPCPSDFTQAFMELGSLVCTPRNPKCNLCPWEKECRARALDIAEELPRKMPKKAKPVRYGKVFWIQKKSGAFLIEKKTAKGLYEGMYQLPTTEWVTDKSKVKTLAVPYGKNMAFKKSKMTVSHSFTHFDLVLEIWSASAVGKFKGCFVSMENVGQYALPTSMQKAVKLCIKG